MSAGPQIKGIESLSWSRLVGLTETGRLDEDITCRKCGYTLRGLFPDSICPECATDIRGSILRDYLKYADPAWLRKLSSGLAWMIGSVAAATGLAVLTVTVGRYLEIIEWLWLAPVVGGILLLAGMFMGCWLFTVPDPHRTERESALSARRIARVSLLCASVLVLAAYYPITHRLMWIPRLIELLVLIWTSSMVVRSRALAARVPDPWLVNLWSILGCLIIVMVVLQILLYAGTYSRFLNGLLCLAVPALFVLGVFAFAAAAMLRVQLEAAAETAIGFREIQQSN